MYAWGINTKMLVISPLYKLQFQAMSFILTLHSLFTDPTSNSSTLLVHWSSHTHLVSRHTLVEKPLEWNFIVLFVSFWAHPLNHSTLIRYDLNFKFIYGRNLLENTSYSFTPENKKTTAFLQHSYRKSVFPDVADFWE